MVIAHVIGVHQFDNPLQLLLHLLISWATIMFAAAAVFTAIYFISKITEPALQKEKITKQ
jgi:hypothetical protein